jgi:CheY-like chemotaxis protein
VAEVGILIVDDDIVSQRALKNVLDAEGWRVRIVPLASHALPELASGLWSLVIANVALTDPRGPLFAILRELEHAGSGAAETADEEDDDVRPPNSIASSHTDSEGDGNSNGDGNGAAPRRVRVLFLVPQSFAKHVQPILEREALPYSLKPYHLHDFLEKVSELLVESGAMADPIRTMGSPGRFKKRRKGVGRPQRDTRRSSMFASREDYQMTEEEMTEWERQEEEDRKKREKEKKDREHLG